MATTATIRTRIDTLDTVLATGAKTVTLDGVTVTLDAHAMREERRRLERQLPESKFKKPLAYKIKLA